MKLTANDIKILRWVGGSSFHRPARWSSTRLMHMRRAGLIVGDLPKSNYGWRVEGMPNHMDISTMSLTDAGRQALKEVA
jgi:hypothetical protein